MEPETAVSGEYTAEAIPLASEMLGNGHETFAVLNPAVVLRTRLDGHCTVGDDSSVSTEKLNEQLAVLPEVSTVIQRTS